MSPVYSVKDVPGLYSTGDLSQRERLRNSLSLWERAGVRVFLRLGINYTFDTLNIPMLFSSDFTEGKPAILLSLPVSA
jgi:hypothetical protein